jgi:serine/threonine protein kinase
MNDYPDAHTVETFCSLPCRYLISTLTLLNLVSRPPEKLFDVADLPKTADTLKRIDVWSLGCVLLSVVLGQPPFWDEDSKKRLPHSDLWFVKRSILSEELLISVEEWDLLGLTSGTARPAPRLKIWEVISKSRQALMFGRC